MLDYDRLKVAFPDEYDAALSQSPASKVLWQTRCPDCDAAPEGGSIGCAQTFDGHHASEYYLVNLETAAPAKTLHVSSVMVASIPGLAFQVSSLQINLLNGSEALNIG